MCWIIQTDYWHFQPENTWTNEPITTTQVLPVCVVIPCLHSMSGFPSNRTDGQRDTLTDCQFGKCQLDMRRNVDFVLHCWGCLSKGSLYDQQEEEESCVTNNSFLHTAIWVNLYHFNLCGKTIRFVFCLLHTLCDVSISETALCFQKLFQWWSHLNEIRGKCYSLTFHSFLYFLRCLRPAASIITSALLSWVKHQGREPYKGKELSDS